MRFRGSDYTGKGVRVAVIDSGINVDDPRLSGAKVEGWSIQLGATGHALLGADFKDEHGHGTEMAAAIRRIAPEAEIIGVKIMDARLRTSADLMAAGIETAYRNGAHVINLSLGTPNMGKALLLRDCCALAVEQNTVVLAAAHPKAERAYPADLPETVGTASHRDCPLEKFYYFAPHRFPRKEWGNLSGKFLAHGHGVPEDGQERGPYRGSGIATAYLAGRIACLKESMGDVTAEEVVETLRQLALTPVPELGYR
jgi:subtilisin family serine protease